MRRTVGTVLAVLLAVVAILGVLGVSACGEASAPITPIPTTAVGTIDTLQFKADAGSATAYLYKPTKPGFAGTVMPVTFIYPDKTVTDATAALDYLVTTGIKDILEYQGSFGVVMTPIASGGYTEADLQIMNSAKGQFSDLGFIRGGIRDAEGGTVTSDSGTQYAGSRFRNYIFADGAGADFIAKYATKSMQYVITFADGGKITFNHLVAAVALFNVKEPADPGAKPEPVPAYIVNGGPGVAESFEAINGKDYPTVSKKAEGGIVPQLAWEAWDLMSQWQRTEATPGTKGVFLMTRYITDYKAAGLDYTEHLWTAIPGVDNGYKYTYFTWAPTGKNNAKRPAVLLFHGGDNSALYFAQTSDWLRVALKNNLVVISVQHSGVTDETGALIPAATATDMKALLDYLLTNTDLNIDPTRVFATGFSMGSLMTTSLAKQYPASFAGFGPCNPAGAMDSGGVVAPVFAVGGLTDPLAKPSAARSFGPDNLRISLTNNGGTPDPAVDVKNVNTFKDPVWGYAPDSFEEFSRNNGNNIYTVNSYKSADGIVYTTYCSVTNMSHETLGFTSWLQWDFFKHFSRNADGTIKYKK
jgi:poly(3-hydroxybutyrate) depolymerase